MESPHSDKSLFRAWRQLVREGQAPPAPAYRDHDPVTFTRGWIAARHQGRGPRANGRWTPLRKAAWEAGVDRGRMAWQDAYRREAYGAIQDGADLLSPDPITALAGPADREWPKQDAADWGRRRGALGVQKPNPYVEGTPGHQAYQQAYDEAAAERARLSGRPGGRGRRRPGLVVSGHRTRWTRPSPAVEFSIPREPPAPQASRGWGVGGVGGQQALPYGRTSA